MTKDLALAIHGKRCDARFFSCRRRPELTTFALTYNQHEARALGHDDRVPRPHQRRPQEEAVGRLECPSLLLGPLLNLCRISDRLSVGSTGSLEAIGSLLPLPCTCSLSSLGPRVGRRRCRRPTSELYSACATIHARSLSSPSAQAAPSQSSHLSMRMSRRSTATISAAPPSARTIPRAPFGIMNLALGSPDFRGGHRRRPGLLLPPTCRRRPRPYDGSSWQVAMTDCLSNARKLTSPERAEVASRREQQPSGPGPGPRAPTGYLSMG